MRDAPDDANTLATLELRAQRPVADEGQAAAPEQGERVREPDDVLALREAADGNVGRAFESK